jgi:hypothetical protein
VSLPFPEPTGPPAPRAEVLLGYLDYFRSVVVSKVQGLSDDQLRTSVLPSGWAVLELVKHLTHVERRWLVWGFEGQPVAQPWGNSQDGRWHVSDTEGSADLVRALQAQGSVTSSVVRAHELCESGGRVSAGREPIHRPSSASCFTFCRSTHGTSDTSTSPANSSTARSTSSAQALPSRSPIADLLAVVKVA